MSFNKINLSKLWVCADYNLEQITNYLLDRKIYTVVNDFPDEKPHIEYDLNDLETVWGTLKLWFRKN